MKCTESGHTGQVPPDMMRSNDRALGIPAGVHVLPELMESRIDEAIEARELVTRDGRR